MPDLDDIRATLARIPNPIGVLENLFALAPVGFQIYEASGRSLLVNQAFLDLFGAEPPPGYNVLKDEIAAKNGVLELIQRAFTGETVTMPPVWYDPRELTQVHVEKANRVAMQATFFPLSNRGGKVSHVAVLFKDMTAETVHREELEQERELLSAVIDQVAEGIVMADAAGVLRLANSAARRLGIRPGTSVSSLADLHDARLPSGEKVPHAEIPLVQALQGNPAHGILQLRLPDGSVRALSSVSVPLRRADGTIRGAVSTLRDETERIRREEELQQSAHFRERFIGILGHDLRSPLTAILAGAGLLLRQHGQLDPVLATAARIQSSAERMARMISDLLDFTQARLGGGLALFRKPCDLRAIAQNAVDEALTANPARTIELTAEGDTTGAFDPDRAAQLLSNLLTNSVSYGPPGQVIAVRLRALESAVQIEIENGGPQVPGSDREALFDPFRRGSRAGPTRGLGLGLFIVQQIARAHGGEVEVDSAPGRTVFRATLKR